MREVDVERIGGLLGDINRQVKRLRELAQLSEDEYLSDDRNYELARYKLVTAAEAAIKICTHLSARLGGKAPNQYGECFTIMSELGVISTDLAQHMRALAGLRNVLVHMYYEVNDVQVLEFLAKDLSDLDEFVRQVRDWLNQTNPTG